MRVLVVDDEPVSRRILKRLLSRFTELDLQEAENGEAAWATLTPPLPGLILCDLSMPVMDGSTLIRKLREHETFSEIPIIVISASNDRETLLDLKDLRILDYLLKPFDLVQTFARLERHLVPRLAANRAKQETARAEAQAAKAAEVKAAKAAQSPAAAPAPEPAVPTEPRPAEPSATP